MRSLIAASAMLLPVLPATGQFTFLPHNLSAAGSAHQVVFSAGRKAVLGLDASIPGAINLVQWTVAGASNSWVVDTLNPPPFGIGSALAGLDTGNVVCLDTQGQTFELTSTGWVNMGVAPVPAQRVLAGFAAIPGGAAILFGGLDLNTLQPLNDTWLYAGGTWIPLPIAGPPPARFAPSMAFDGTRIVLFGGQNLSVNFGDTWTLTTPGVWTLLAPLASPAAGTNLAMAGRPVDGDVLLAGAGPAGNEIWTLTGSTWTQDTAVVPFAVQSAAFDAVHNEVIAVSGGGQTAAIGTFGGRTYGVGCSCGGGPLLSIILLPTTAPTVSPPGLPRIGQQIRLGAVGVPASSPSSLLFMAFSGTRTAGTPGVFCTDWITAGGGTVGMTNNLNGSAQTAPIPIANSASLIGLTLFYEMFDFSAACSSNGVEVRVGR
jgi:hypothetical protein